MSVIGIVNKEVKKDQNLIYGVLCKKKFYAKMLGFPVNPFLATNPSLRTTGKPLYIPKCNDCHDFYNKLIENDTVIDDTESFNDTPDFEIDEF